MLFRAEVLPEPNGVLTLRDLGSANLAPHEQFPRSDHYEACVVSSAHFTLTIAEISAGRLAIVQKKESQPSLSLPVSGFIWGSVFASAEAGLPHIAGWGAWDEARVPLGHDSAKSHYSYFRATTAFILDALKAG
jgi:hypothetical protein